MAAEKQKQDTLSAQKPEQQSEATTVASEEIPAADMPRIPVDGLEDPQDRQAEAPPTPQEAPPTPQEAPPTPQEAQPTPQEAPQDKFELPNVKNMGFGDLLKSLIETGLKLKGQFASLFGGKEGPLKNLEEANTNKFTPEDYQKVAVNLAKNAEKKDYTQNQSAEYVASVLNLPARENVQLFMNALTDPLSNRVLVTDQNRLKELEVGDVLFFQKENEKKEKLPYLTAVVSSVKPLKMKMIPDGGAPVELTVMDSDYFKNHWLGFVKLPRKSADAVQVAEAGGEQPPTSVPVPQTTQESPPKA